jgi:DNA-directed RNA polymerase specialized sigma24 family protein
VKVLQRDWSLDATAWDLLLNALHPERDAAAARYEEIRLVLIRYFRTHGSLVPEENSDEVVNRVARKLADGTSLDLGEHHGYFLTVAHFVLKEYFHAAKRQFVPVDDVTNSPEFSSDPIAEAERLRERIEKEIGIEAVRHCRDRLAESEREILDIYDTGSGGEKIRRRNELAERLGKTKGALVTEISRIRTRLKNCTLKRLRELGIIEGM